MIKLEEILQTLFYVKTFGGRDLNLCTSYCKSVFSERLQVFGVSPSPSQARLVRPVVLVEVRFLKFLGVSHRPCVSCIIGQM